MRSVILMLLLTLIGNSVAWGGAFEDGKAAYERRDYKTALEKFHSAAQQGDAKAQYNLGQIYRNGLGIPRDNAEAVKWYRLAAQQGHAKAQNNLGMMYYSGQGVPRDYVRAHVWFSLAIASGGARAEGNRDIAASKMTPQQIAKAKKMAKDCLANKLKGCN